jgi:hypothetical protein
MPEQIPETIGRYKVLAVLGKGAMGIVYKAVDPAIDREVAIKTIKLSLSEEELAQYEARFAQEIKTVGKLNHPHIVPIYDVGRTDQFAYMAMEFIDGTTSKIGRNPKNGMVAKARLWIEAFLGHGVETDEITSETPTQLIGKYATGFFENRERETKTGEKYTRLSIMRLNPYKAGAPVEPKPEPQRPVEVAATADALPF